MTRKKKKAKISHSTELPYSPPPWPRIAASDQETILQLLCDFLSPIGQHRRTDVQRSKGKRARQRRNKGKKHKAENAMETQEPSIALPLAPNPADFVTIGFNMTTGMLQNLSHLAVSSRLTDQVDLEFPAKRMIAVFVCASTLPPVLTSSLPVLVAAASLRLPATSQIRLVSLPPSSEERLADALFQPRVGFVGALQDAPGAQPLVDFVLEKVSPVQVPWLQNPEGMEYMPVKVQSSLFECDQQGQHI